MSQSEALGVSQSKSAGANGSIRSGMSAEIRAFLAGAQSAFIAGEFGDAKGLIAQAEAISKDEMGDAQLLGKFMSRARYNAAIVEYYASEMSNVDKLLELTFPGQDVAHKMQNNRENLGEEVLTNVFTSLGAVPLYNYAVICYQCHNLDKAKEVLEFLFDDIETLEDWLAIRLSFLLLDVYFRLEWFYGEKAADVLSFLDSCFAANEPVQDDNGDGVSDEFPQVAPRMSAQQLSKVAILAPAHSQLDAQFLIHVYRARHKAIIDNHKAFIKEAKSAVSAADDASLRPTAAALVLKAHMEKSLRKGITHLTGASHPVSVLKPLILNNLGVIHHRLGRHALAVVYLISAQHSFDELLTSTDWKQKGGDRNSIIPESLPQLGLHRRADVAYNLGLEYLMLRQYGDAFHMFNLSADQLSSVSPRLWLRLAECYVGLSENTGKSNAADQAGGLIEEVIGKGSKRRAILNPPKRERTRRYIEIAQTCAKAGLSLLERKMAEMNKRKEGSSRPGSNSGGNPASDTLASGQTGDGEYEQRQLETKAVEAALLLMLCFCNLEFGKYEQVVEFGKKVMNLKLAPRAIRGRAQLYMGEAQCRLGNFEDAVRLLDPNEDDEVEGKLAFMINFSIAQLHRGQNEEAESMAEHAASMLREHPTQKSRRQLHLLQLYLAQRKRDRKTAKTILERSEITD